MNHATHACAVCPKQIGHAYLMCVRHWRLVPHTQQQAVYRTWRQYSGVGGRSGYALTVRAEYFVARDAAIEHARAALGLPAGPAVAVPRDNSSIPNSESASA